MGPMWDIQRTQTGPSYLEGSVHGVSAGRPVTKTTEASLHTHTHTHRTKLSLSGVLSTTLDRHLLPRRPDGRPEPLRVPPGPVLTGLAGVGTVGWGANTHRKCLSLRLKGATPSSLGAGVILSPRKQLPEPSVSRVADDDFHVGSPGLRDHVHCLHGGLLVKPAARAMTLVGGTGGGWAGHAIGGRRD